jgi:DNA-binding response OmpR family regulator
MVRLLSISRGHAILRRAMRLLIIEDEIDLAAALGTGLRREGYAVDVAASAAEAYERLMDAPYDVICLDLGLPDADGREVCRRLRAGELTPPDWTPPRVIMLTARDALDDRVAGLDDGADDYLVKPFSFAELAARVRALARRPTINNGASIRLGSLELDAARHEAHRNDQRLDLTPKEFALLRYLMLHPSEVLTPERLLEHVWDDRADPFTNTVRVTVSNLRRKLADAGSGQPIETVVGVGYRLAEDVA